MAPVQAPVNQFKRALLERRVQFGLWLGLTDPLAAELLAGTGFDWLLVDGEHAPNHVGRVIAQLQAIAPYPAQAVVRPLTADAALIKQVLDIGALTLLVPMIDDAPQAAATVRAMRYPPRGVRGVGSALARASRWNSVPEYLEHAEDELCLLAQAESTLALSQLDAIAATEGVHGVFFGPADLSASMGFLGQPGHPEVQAVICDGIARVRAKGKAAGVLATDPIIARRYLDAGALFVALGADTALLGRSASEALSRIRAPSSESRPGEGAY